jgi:DNA-3-methyladenine glycosylase I
MSKITRCAWVNLSNPLYIKYHDEEWGVPLYDDQKLFELLILEGAQAGLSWEIILNRRENYRKLFHNFNIAKLASLPDEELEKILTNSGIIRNRLKIYSVKKNAKIFQQIQQEFGKFSIYLWNFVNNQITNNNINDYKDYQTKNLISDAISKDLKKRGMSFVGSTIIYAFMQAVGMVNDHANNCFRKKIK